MLSIDPSSTKPEHHNGMDCVITDALVKLVVKYSSEDPELKTRHKIAIVLQ